MLPIEPQAPYNESQFTAKLSKTGRGDMLFQKELQQAKKFLEYFKKEFEIIRAEQKDMAERICKMEQDIMEIKKILKKES